MPEVGQAGGDIGAVLSGDTGREQEAIRRRKGGEDPGGVPGTDEGERREGPFPGLTGPALFIKRKPPFSLLTYAPKGPKIYRIFVLRSIKGGKYGT